MKLRAVVAVSLALSLGAVITGCSINVTPPRRDGGLLADGGVVADADGDGISDQAEGRAMNVDTDGDGQADYLDADSDNDGIPDMGEAGDPNPGTPPVDSDSDGVPDFRDDDSDGNGILDSAETVGDVDGDGTPDFADRDDDNDQVTDIMELSGMAPVDTDGDGHNDYQDSDSDNDTILDGHERDADTDRDGTPDVRDLDSDNDGLIDVQEAGDTDVSSVPVDTDSDGVPNFRDADSDNDGLSDTDEVTVYHTSPILPDSDGDGVDDIIEIAGGTSPNDNASSPLTEGNFVFEVPYMMPPVPERDTLEFATSIQFADVYFLFDYSGSMNLEIAALQSGVNGLIGDLTCADSGVPCAGLPDCATGQFCSPFTSTCTEDPALSTCVPSLYSGTGRYSDANTMENRTSLQGDPSVTANPGLNYTASAGGSTERLFDAVRAVADPGAVTGEMGCLTATGLLGCPGFRSEAVRILVAFTDEASNGHTSTLAQATAALNAAGITTIGVWSGAAGSAARNDLRNVVTGTNSYRADGVTPLFYEGTDAGVVGPLTTAIHEIVEGVPLRVTIGATDLPGDAGDSLQFIAGLPTNTTSPGCSNVLTDNGDAEGTLFPAVTPGTPVCFDVLARQNDTVMPTLVPLIFQAELTIYGDGSPLDRRRVFFLVRPRIEAPGGPD